MPFSRLYSQKRLNEASPFIDFVHKHYLVLLGQGHVMICIGNGSTSQLRRLEGNGAFNLMENLEFVRTTVDYIIQEKILP